MKTAFAFALTAFVFSAVTFAQPQQRDLRLEPIRVQKKIALVIGNQAYPKSPLRNPINDAAAIAQALRALRRFERGQHLSIVHVRYPWSNCGKAVTMP